MIKHAVSLINLTNFQNIFCNGKSPCSAINYKLHFSKRAQLRAKVQDRSSDEAFKAREMIMCIIHGDTRKSFIWNRGSICPNFKLKEDGKIDNLQAQLSSRQHFLKTSPIFKLIAARRKRLSLKLILMSRGGKECFLWNTSLPPRSVCAL